VRWALVILIACWAARTLHSEKYLTIEQAQRLCFPAAARFEARSLKFTAAEIEAIEKATGAPTPNTGNRVVQAYGEDHRFLGVLFIDRVLGKHELIDYAVAITPDGKIAQVEILEYRESYGGEIRSPRWRSQFEGKSAAAPLRLNKDIYNISGATMSCRHVTEGIKRVLATFNVLYGGGRAAARMQNAGASRG
jgi:Na+-translocating ferredoxin:NAD+ oxidoreductase RnfG subunit